MKKIAVVKPVKEGFPFYIIPHAKGKNCPWCKYLINRIEIVKKSLQKRKEKS